MVKKLYKHEFLSLLRWLIPVDLGCLLMAAISRLALFLGDSTPERIIKSLTGVFFGMSVFAMFIIGYVVVIRRFYTNLLKNEGYFTHTIPVKTSTHINCKIVCGLLFIIVNFIVAILSLLIIGAGTGVWPQIWDAFKKAMKLAADSAGAVNFTVYVIETVLIMLFGLLLFLQQVYASMAMGQRMKSKAGGAVLWYFIFYVIMQVSNSFLIIGENAVVTSTGLRPVELTHTMLGISLGVQIIWNVIYYVITRVQLSRHLNLE